mgnify:CR=1 FL=1
MGRARSESSGDSEALVSLLMQRAVVDEPRTIADFLTMVVAAETVHTDAAQLLQTTVTSARAAGATWQSIGSSLGITKQAAQKRFAQPGVQGGLDPNERILGPTTTFDELQELALAGRYGWHSVEVGASYHRMLRSPTAWEHLRVTMSAVRVRQLRDEGWTVIHAGFPYTYLKRDTGVVALLEPTDL